VLYRNNDELELVQREYEQVIEISELVSVSHKHNSELELVQQEYE
jgi:hypothetical protein